MDEKIRRYVAAALEIEVDSVVLSRVIDRDGKPRVHIELRSLIVLARDNVAETIESAIQRALREEA